MNLTRRPGGLRRLSSTRARRSAAILAVGVALACRTDDGTSPFSLVEIESITIDTVPFLIERGTSAVVRATARDAKGKAVDIPVVWKTTADSVARFDATGRLIARDTGTVAVTASALGVTSQPLAVRVVWDGPAVVELLDVEPGEAVGPSAVLADSIRVLVRNRLGVPLPGARVRFTVTGGGSPGAEYDTTDALGRASVAWTLGPSAGVNTITVAAVDETGQPLTRVAGNPSSYAVTSYDALTPVAGDAQTGQILSDLSVLPMIRLVDASGAPRAGVPVTFTATRGGRVEVVTASTGADGRATPGTWTLGDLPGEQKLVVSVESAALTFTATATGTPIYYRPSRVIAGAFSTCALEADGLVKCWGEAPQNGGGNDTTSVATPTPTAGGITFTSVTGGISHYCGIGAADQSIYCWGTNALADTTGVSLHASAPQRLGSTLSWIAVAPGGAHNCAIAADQTAWCWGDNSRSQLGDRTGTTRLKPAPVSGGFTFAAISAGSQYNCGLTLDGTALCWGANAFGQLGDGTTSDRNAPTAVGGGSRYKAIGTGDVMSCGLTVAGVARCWGVLTGSNQPVTTPQSMTGAPTLSSLTVGGGHACGLDVDGGAWCWGANGFGQLGDSSTTARANPVKVSTPLRFSSISAGLAHTCAITTDGAVVCWGRNRGGEHGDRIVTFRTTPRHVILGVNP